jgi:hypothetical protein
VPVIPIFVSSTFRDFHGERDALASEVRARLDEEIAHLGCRVAFIDLRWGVDTLDIESAEERQRRVFEVCLSEIDRSQPLFVGLIGGRYGWLPPSRLAQRIAGFAGAKVGSDWSITELEFEHGAFSRPPGSAVFFLRNVSGIPPTTWVDEDTRPVDRLRNRAIQYDPTRAIEYHVDASGGRITAEDRDRFVDLMVNHLGPMVIARAESLGSTNQDPYESAEAILIEERMRSLIGRDLAISDLVSRLLSGNARICLSGAHGSGKSAIWAAVLSQLRSKSDKRGPGQRPLLLSSSF